MPKLRLLAYNTHGLRVGARKVAKAISDEWPDIILMNECGFLGLRLRRLARRLGMQAHSGLRMFRPVTNAVLVRPPWRVIERHNLQFSRVMRRQRRGVVAARIGHAGYRLTIASVHLGLSDPERVRHAKELTDFLAGLAGPHVLGGDLNEGPERPAAQWISERFWDAFAIAGEGEAETFPSRDPRARIDFLFVSEGITVKRAWVGSDPAMVDASDHRPVFADVVLEEVTRPHEVPTENVSTPC
jgi:endonuclease/exonuclease/phosphatase family metal-dependent hydrolase